VPHGYRGSRRGIARRARPASRLSDARRTRYGQDHPGAALPAGGNRAGERALLITLESNEAQLRSDAAAQGIDLEGVHVLDLSPTREFFAENQSYDIFSPADVERDPTTRQIIETVQEHQAGARLRGRHHHLALSVTRRLPVSQAGALLSALSRGERSDGGDELRAHDRTLGMQFMKEAATRGERSVVYAFEEQKDTLLHRCMSVGIPVREMIEEGSLSVVQVEPLRFSPAEFALLVRREVEERGARIVMIDGISGYRLTLAGDDLVTQLHALGRYLKNMGVTVLFINEVEGITGDFRATEVGVSYLCDNLVFLRYLEIDGELRKAIGVLKKRVGDFGKALRELQITDEGVRVGDPLSGLRGVLTGTPEWVDRRGMSDPG
jgi:KaiC/GvpD/RAD55 family RecA-like ATPase